MLKIIDTNYAIRYLVQDDYNKALEAKSIIDEGAYILPESLVELVYVLQKAYNTPRQEIGYGILNLLDDVEMVEKRIYEEAARLYVTTDLSYVDCILSIRHKLLNDRIYTLDKRLKKEVEAIYVWKFTNDIYIS